MTNDNALIASHDILQNLSIIVLHADTSFETGQTNQTRPTDNLTPKNYTHKKGKLTMEDHNRSVASATDGNSYPAVHVVDKSTVVECTDTPILHTTGESTHLEPIFH